MTQQPTQDEARQWLGQIFLVYVQTEDFKKMDPEIQQSVFRAMLYYWVN